MGDRSCESRAAQKDGEVLGQEAGRERKPLPVRSGGRDGVLSALRLARSAVPVPPRGGASAQPDDEGRVVLEADLLALPEKGPGRVQAVFRDRVAGAGVRT